jgi:hypothetical protein
LHFDTDLLRQEAADAEAGGGAPAAAAVAASVMSKSTASVSNASRRRTTSSTTSSRRCWYLYHFCYSFVLPQLLWGGTESFPFPFLSSPFQLRNCHSKTFPRILKAFPIFLCGKTFPTFLKPFPQVYKNFPAFLKPFLHF